MVLNLKFFSPLKFENTVIFAVSLDDSLRVAHKLVNLLKVGWRGVAPSYNNDLHRWKIARKEQRKGCHERIACRKRRGKRVIRLGKIIRNNPPTLKTH